MKKIPFYIQILIALVAGILCGSLLPGGAKWIAWLGKLFMNALCMLIVPVIFFSISTSVQGICDKGGSSLGRIGAKTIGLYVVTMILAIATGIILVNIIRPGAGVSTTLIGSEAAQASVSATDTIASIIPSNIFEAFTHNNTIPIIFISILVGYFVTKISDEGKGAVGRFLRGGYELTLKVMEVVIRFAPLGIFAILWTQFAQVSDVLGLIHNMLMYIVTVTAGLLFHTFITLPLLLRFVAKVHPWQHFRNMGVPLLTAFSTASSGATIPLTLAAVKEKDGVSSGVADFVISLGATINMNGAALLECVAVIFIAQAYGIDLTISQMLMVSGVSLLCAIGSAGIPMSAMVMMAVILNAVGLPVEGIGLVIGVDRILDMLRTSVNVYGDTCVAVMVAKSEKEQLTIDR